MQDQIVKKLKMLMDQLPEEMKMTVIKICSGEEPDSPRVKKIIKIYDKLTPEEQAMFNSYITANGGRNNTA